MSTTTTLASPFLLSPKSTALLTNHLTSSTPSKTVLFCSRHKSASTPSSLKTYLLHHATIRTLLLPLSHLLARATSLAIAVLPQEHHANDLERAFLGPARDAVVWYTSLADEEAGWLAAVCRDAKLDARSSRCPGCMVDHTLHSQSTIRLMLAACRVARAERLTDADASDAEPELSSPILPADADDLPPPPPANTLPSLARRWQRAVEDAVRADAFWTPSPASTTCADERTRARRLAAALLVLEDQVEQLADMLAEYHASRTPVGRGSSAGYGSDADEGDDETDAVAAVRHAVEEAEKREQTRRVVDAFVRAWVSGNGAGGRCAREAEGPNGGAGRKTYAAGGAALRPRGPGRLRSITS